MTELPTTFGKYYLTEKLATGGMAEIFLGKLIGPGGFEKQLVIKQIHPALSGQRHFVDLFVAEAKTLVSLTHGNIVPVYELGVVDDTYFIAMEYIDGPTLHQLTEARFRRGGAMAPAMTGWIIAEIARGLDYAHRKGVGVVHRDLSPRNVMLSREGEVKIVDFGIAVDHGTGDDARDDDRMPTGSFAYMSPEQVARRPLTGQSDLFSLGVLAWEMLVGDRLFARATPEATLDAVRAEPIVPPSSRRPEVPPRLDEIVMRALERDPTRRWASAAELLVPLQRYLFSLTTTPGPREVATLVAATCPPTGRRLPTDGGPGTPRREPAATAGADEERTPASGDRAAPTTAVSPERRRKRPSTAREATFATHVDLERALGKTPPPPAPAEPVTRVVARPPVEAQGSSPALAPVADEAAPTDGAEAAGPSAVDRAAIVPGPAPGPAPGPVAVPPPASGPASVPPSAGSTAHLAQPAPPRTGRRIATATAALAAAVALVLVLRPCRDAGPTRSAAPRLDASATTVDAPALALALDAGADAALAAPTDAALAAPTDAAPAAPVDAAGATAATRPTDARRAEPDSRRADPDARPPTTASARLKVGADPWGEVYLDGRRLGRAPNAWPVSPGAHVVEVVFPSEDGELRRRFPIDVAAGAEAAVFADFRAAGGP